MKYCSFVLMVFTFTLNTYAATKVNPIVINETWIRENSPYIVDNDVEVKSLVITPGVSVLFNGNYKFKITGFIKANGAKNDSIIFSAITDDKSWDGINFEGVAPGSVLSYCIIEHSNNSGIRFNDASPVSSDLLINNCALRFNTAPGKGAGICSIGKLKLEACRIYNNYISANLVTGSGAIYGAGIYAKGDLALSRCTISNNYLYLFGYYVSSFGGGVFIDGSLNLLHCILRGNRASAYTKGLFSITGAYSPGHGTAYGGAIYANTKSMCILNNCLVASDSVIVMRHSPNEYQFLGGGGVFSKSDSICIINCTISYNINEGVDNNLGKCTILNSIIYFNSLKQIEGNVDCNFSNVQDGYAGNDNLCFNPNYKIDRVDFSLAEGSPCIDAGDPNTPKDYIPSLDLAFHSRITNSHIDMGCYEFLKNSIDITARTEINSFKVFQNYPNPFNLYTSISYHIPERQWVTLKLFNFLGKEIVTLVDKQHEAGIYTAVWDGYDKNGNPLSSGIYFCQICAGKYTKNGKMILVK